MFILNPCVQPHFNPRAPRGARLQAGGARHGDAQFQSTRPTWGATTSRRCATWRCPISIHAPHVGRDHRKIDIMPRNARFQSTRPTWGATTPALRGCSRSTFQSTRPTWGATPPPSLTTMTYLNFNPRAPRGARPQSSTIDAISAHFNPRAPRGARPAVYFAPLAHRIFQSTRPTWGATSGCGKRGKKRLHFNPRAPRGARRERRPRDEGVHRFQSTRPTWGATPCRHILRNAKLISIHAPHVGRDIVAAALKLAGKEFQSTRPTWGATCGSPNYLSQHNEFQSTRPTWGATSLYGYLR